jgi:hypothetical protein
MIYGHILHNVIKISITILIAIYTSLQYLAFNSRSESGRKGCTHSFYSYLYLSSVILFEAQFHCKSILWFRCF